MMTSYVYAYGVVMPTELEKVLGLIQQETGCAYASVYRGEDAQALLNEHGLHTQAQIYYEYEHGEEPNPANPPGRSTHELRSDGVPYPGPIGRHLEPWQCGIDVDVAHVEAFIAAAYRHGWIAYRPYPTGSEYHHVNFRKAPTVANPFLPLHEGKTGLWVYILNGRLRQMGYHQDGLGKGPLIKHWGRFDGHTEAAVKRFQKQHGLTQDGIVGQQTWLSIKDHAAHAKKRK